MFSSSRSVLLFVVIKGITAGWCWLLSELWSSNNPLKKNILSSSMYCIYGIPKVSYLRRTREHLTWKIDRHYQIARMWHFFISFFVQPLSRASSSKRIVSFYCLSLIEEIVKYTWDSYSSVHTATLFFINTVGWRFWLSSLTWPWWLWFSWMYSLLSSATHTAKPRVMQSCSMLSIRLLLSRE